MEQLPQERVRARHQILTRSGEVRRGGFDGRVIGEAAQADGSSGQLKGELTRLGADVAAIDRVFRMVEPDYRPEAPDKKSPNRHASAKNLFPPGKMTVAMLEALRLLNHPVTSAECATAMLTNGGFDVDGETMATVVNRVSALLGQKAGGGQIERAGHGEGRQVLWRIVR